MERGACIDKELDHKGSLVQPFLCQQRETLDRLSFAVVSSLHGLVFHAVMRETPRYKEEEKRKGRKRGREWGRKRKEKRKGRKGGRERKERGREGGSGEGRGRGGREGVGREEEEEREGVGKEEEMNQSCIEGANLFLGLHVYVQLVLLNGHDQSCHERVQVGLS